MRLVFVLYAEDRELLPSLPSQRVRDLYDENYSVRGFYDRLVEDQALNPDTMDERVGGWGRLLALFRLILSGHRSGFVHGRGGQLFDPNAFPFIEGRLDRQYKARVLRISDGCLLRILDGLMSLTGERLSYKALDVEQIGSVYETVMGFTVQRATGPSLAIKAGKNNRTPAFVDLEALLAAKPNQRKKFLKENCERASLSAGQETPIKEATTVAEMAAVLDPIVDERASPAKHVIAEGTPVLQPTDERRGTGSHYTPRTLTEPIVGQALEPILNRLGDDATPEQVLELEVCDPAMGSGAFLVEACRQLAARLTRAWKKHPGTRRPLPSDEDEDLHARRLVAQRCLYGVDRNLMATDLARLSLWLATLARDHEFTFLDHALKTRDSLVGLTREQIATLTIGGSENGVPLLRPLVTRLVGEAAEGRRQIQTAPDDVELGLQEVRNRQIDEQLDRVRQIGNALVSTFFAES